MLIYGHIYTGLSAGQSARIVIPTQWCLASHNRLQETLCPCTEACISAVAALVLGRCGATKPHGTASSLLPGSCRPVHVQPSGECACPQACTSLALSAMHQPLDLKKAPC